MGRKESECSLSFFFKAETEHKVFYLKRKQNFILYEGQKILFKYGYVLQHIEESRKMIAEKIQCNIECVKPIKAEEYYKETGEPVPPEDDIEIMFEEKELKSGKSEKQHEKDKTTKQNKKVEVK